MQHQSSRARFGAIAATATAAVVLLAGCAGGGGTMDETAADTVRIDLSKAPDSLDPINNPYLDDTQIVALTSATLFQFAKGSATETEPVLADTIDVSDDGITHTIVIKDGLEFSDDSALTAEEVAISLNRLKDIPSVNQLEIVTFAEIAATDDHTVEITLAEPSADITEILALPATGIVAPAGVGDDAYFEGDPVFSGAYVPEGEISDSFTLVRNEAFHPYTPAIERLEFSVTGDAVTTVTRLQGGEIDLATTVPPESVGQISGENTTASVERVASLYLVPNNREGSIFSDVRIRQALAWALDREALATVVYGDGAVVQSGPYPVPADYPVPVEVYPAQDLDKAAELLEGTACESGCSATVSYFSTDPGSGRAAVALQQMVEPLGIQIQALPVETQQFIQDSLDGAFDMNMVESGSFNVPASLRGAFDTVFTVCIYAGCANDDMDPAIGALLAASPEEAEAASEEVLTIFQEWTPIIPIAGVTSTYGVRADLADTIVMQPNYTFWIAAE